MTAVFALEVVAADRKAVADRRVVADRKAVADRRVVAGDVACSAGRMAVADDTKSPVWVVD